MPNASIVDERMWSRIVDVVRLNARNLFCYFPPVYMQRECRFWVREWTASLVCCIHHTNTVCFDIESYKQQTHTAPSISQTSTQSLHTPHTQHSFQHIVRTTLSFSLFLSSFLSFWSSMGRARFCFFLSFLLFIWLPWLSTNNTNEWARIRQLHAVATCFFVAFCYITHKHSKNENKAKALYETDYRDVPFGFKEFFMNARISFLYVWGCVYCVIWYTHIVDPFTLGPRKCDWYFPHRFWFMVIDAIEKHTR